MKSTKQVARKRSQQAERHAQILDAAFEVFAANGYAAARMDDVAKRANIGKGTIFLHFRDKKALFRAVLCRLIHPVQADAEAQVQEFAGGSQTALRDLLSRLYVEIVENKKARALLRLLIAEGERFPELSEIYYREIIVPGASAIGLVVEKGIASGEFSATKVTGFPQILAAPAILAVVWSLLLGKRHGLDLEAYREAHLEFVQRGLCGAVRANASRGPTVLRGREPA
ncbi:MAG TPA: TetR/AcrR family transcriptional regulator [Candidatus Acidoferrales bacterium]|nr:TetR/AcrR family transcriptional regulator [Candidatus Acidoferrales bacterium]